MIWTHRRLFYKGEGKDEKAVCIFLAIVLCAICMMEAGIFGAIVGAIGGYCLGAKITS